MSNEINALQKFFEYLTQNNKSAQDVVNEADVNDDEILTKGEFKKYVDGVGLNLTADEVSQVFKIFDTNTKGRIDNTKLNHRNALDDKEVKAMQVKLEAYQKVRDALNAVFGEGFGNVTIPHELKPHVLRASVEESVMANMNSNFNDENLEALLTQAIARTGANGYGQFRFNELLQKAKQECEVPASYNGDDDFQSLLTAYVRNLGPTAYLGSIIDDINAIVETYFASAEISGCDAHDEVTEPGNPLYDYGWHDAQGLNGLQLAVLADQILKDYNGVNNGVDPKIYNKFKSEFDAAIQGFISEECFGMTFKEIQADLSAKFQASKYGKALEVLIKLSDFNAPQGDDPYLNAATLDEQFYNALHGAFGLDFAKALASADVNYVESQGLYYNILQTVYRMVMSGEIENNYTDIVNKMIELISENYAEFKSGLGLYSSNGDVEDLYENFTNLHESGTVALAVLKDSAIAYLDALSALGNESLNSFIKSTFGDDYKTAIEQLMSQDALKEKIDAVHTKYTELMDAGVIAEEVDPFSYKVASWDVSEVPSFYVGGSAKSFSCAATSITPDPSGQSPIPQITYDIETNDCGTGSTATINPSTGAVTFTPGALDGTAIIKVKVMVNGVEIGTKEIQVNVQKKKFNESNAGISLGGIQIPVNGSDLGWNKSRDNAITNFNTNIADKLKQAAIAQGFDATKADNAAKTLKSYFYAAMHALNSTLSNGLTSQFEASAAGATEFYYTRYTDDGTINERSTDRSTVKAKRDDEYVDEYEDVWSKNSTTGIYIGCDITGTDDYWVFVSGQKMIELFAKFLG